MLLLRKIPLRGRDDQLVAFFQTNTEAVQDLADVRLPLLRLDLQPHIAEIADRVAVIVSRMESPCLSTKIWISSLCGSRKGVEMSV